MIKLLTPLLATALLTTALASSAVAAREVDRAEVAEVFNPEVEQERRVYCRDTQVFTFGDGSTYRACVNWRAQVRTRLIRTYAALDGPDEDSDENLSIARDCFDLAVASQNDPYREKFEEEPFLAGAKGRFAFCANRRGLQDTNKYSLRVYESGVWLGGR